MTPHDEHLHRILAEIEISETVSQRSLARRAGVALGLINLLVRRSIRKGWVRAIQIRPNRVRYFITPQGLAEKARMSRAYLDRSIHFYSQARSRISDRFADLSGHWPADGPKRIAFLGAGEVAEIGYVCLQETDLRLVAVIDAERVQPFFGLPVASASSLVATGLPDVPFDRLVVMSFGDELATRVLLDASLFPPARVHWL